MDDKKLDAIIICSGIVLAFFVFSVFFQQPIIEWKNHDLILAKDKFCEHREPQNLYSEDSCLINNEWKPFKCFNEKNVWNCNYITKGD